MFDNHFDVMLSIDRSSKREGLREEMNERRIGIDNV
jgi:hypothetical protein